MKKYVAKYIFKNDPHILKCRLKLISIKQSLFMYCIVPFYFKKGEGRSYLFAAVLIAGGLVRPCGSSPCGHVGTLRSTSRGVAERMLSWL
jgi:hypothetical protein